MTFKDLSMTVSQWALLSLAALVGYLVIVLRLQKTRLHRAQVDLLQKSVLLDTKKDEDEVSKARAAYIAALGEYHK